MKLRLARKIYRKCAWHGFCPVERHRRNTTVAAMLRVERSGERVIWSVRNLGRALAFYILINAVNCFGAGETIPVETFDKPGSLQAYQQALDDKFSVRGGTVSAFMRVSSLTVTGPLAATANATVAGTLSVSGTFTAEAAASFSGTTSTPTFSGGIGVQITTTTAQCNGAATCTVTCPTGYKVIAGGCNINASATNLTQSEPANANWIAWHCQAAGGTPDITAYAMCGRFRFDAP